MKNQIISIYEVLNYSMKFHNFEFFEKEWINESNFLNYAIYDHYYLVNHFLKTNATLNINQTFKHFIK